VVGVGVVICLEQGTDLHTAQLMALPLTVSCFSKIQTGFTFLVPAHPGSPGQRAIKRVSMSMAPTDPELSDRNRLKITKQETAADHIYAAVLMLSK